MIACSTSWHLQVVGLISNTSGPYGPTTSASLVWSLMRLGTWWKECLLHVAHGMPCESIASRCSICTWGSLLHSSGPSYYSVLCMASPSKRAGAHASTIPCVRVVTQRLKVLWRKHLPDLFDLILVQPRLQQDSVQFALRSCYVLKCQNCILCLISHFNSTFT